MTQHPRLTGSDDIAVCLAMEDHGSTSHTQPNNPHEPAHIVPDKASRMVTHYVHKTACKYHKGRTASDQNNPNVPKRRKIAFLC